MRFRPLFFILVLVAGLLATVQLWRATTNIYSSRRRVEELAAEVVGLEKEKQRLETEKAFRQSPGFVEQEARDRLGMVKAGEKVVVIPDAQKGAETNAEERGKVAGLESKPNWKEWVDFWFGL